MSFGGNQGGEGGNVWSSGSHGGSRGDFSRSYDDDDGQGSRDRPYRGSYGNSYSRGGGSGGSSGGGSYGFRRDRDNDRQTEIQRDTIFIQDLPKDVTKEQLQDAFSGVGRIKIDDRSGGPKVWLYKDRVTDEGNGRATVTYEDEETATRAISEYNDQHIDSLGVTVRVQQAQRRLRTNDRGGFGGGSGGGRGYRGGRSGWDSNNSRSGGGFSSDGNRWGGSRGGGSSGGFSDSRGGGYRSQGGYGGGGGDSYRSSDDRDGSYRGGSQHRGASRGRGGYSNYSPY